MFARNAHGDPPEANLITGTVPAAQATEAVESAPVLTEEEKHAVFSETPSISFCAARSVCWHAKKTACSDPQETLVVSHSAKTVAGSSQPAQSPSVAGLCAG
ncbi:MAG: hypothetical protein JSW68_06890 [Burkholderiales bacterium]|nr:MAG: hypothetical protein JSW68_06890 [Burkholderiales bacterium]